MSEPMALDCPNGCGHSWWNVGIDTYDCNRAAPPSDPAAPLDVEHGYTCTYCTSTGGDPIYRPTWHTRLAYEQHHEQTHHGLPYEPPMADWATHRHAPAPPSDPAAPLREALEDISYMLPGSIPLPMTEEEYLRSMLMQCVRTARAALATPAPKEADRE